MVYDKTDDQIHLLDGTTATVFELLEQGAASEAIESMLNAQQTVAPGAELLAMALEELSQARLLEGKAAQSEPVMEGRRKALQKLVGVGAALLIPAIVTLAPSRAYAQTGSGAVNSTCSANGQCGPGLCCPTNSAGTGCHTKQCSPVGCNC